MSATVLADSDPIGGRYSLRGSLQMPEGDLWEAEDRKQGRPVTIEFFRDCPAGSHKARGILRQAEKLRARSHPNLVQVLDYGEGGNIVFVVSEFIEPPTLNAWLRRNEYQAREFSGEEVFWIFQRVCKGLAMIREYTDRLAPFSPGNVFIILEHAADLRVKVRPFGLATLSPHRREAIFGDGRYLSPRLTADTGLPAGPRDDTFALGILLVELLIRPRLPSLLNDERFWRDGAAAAVGNLRQVVAEQCAPLDVWEVLQLALSADPLERPQTQLQMLHMVSAAWPEDWRPPGVSLEANTYHGRLRWLRRLYGRLSEHVTGIAVTGDFPKGPNARPDETELPDSPWFSVYRPTWVRPEVSFSIHVYVVPNKEATGAVDRSARLHLSVPGNRADRVVSLSLARHLTDGEIIACRIECIGFDMKVPTRQSWRGKPLKFMINGVARRKTRTGEHRPVLTIFTQSDAVPEDVLGASDFDLAVAEFSPRETAARVGIGLVCGLTSIASMHVSLQGHPVRPIGICAAVLIGGGGIVAVQPLVVSPMQQPEVHDLCNFVIEPRQFDILPLVKALTPACVDLPGPILERACNALVDAYPSQERLDRLTRFELETSLDMRVAHGSLADVVFGLLRSTQADGSTARLLAGAHARKPDHVPLANVINVIRDLKPH